ncbi:MAG: glycosyltransferase family 39 protein, partial [Flavisolibacter sp.]
MIYVFKQIRREWGIGVVLILAFLLRVYGLTFQSLWLDELHNMNEADPDITWGAMFNYLKCCDQHPPLYFIVQRLSFTVLGHTEFVARIISVIAGTVSIWAVWILGKAILNRRLGLIAAILTSVNYYNLFYSQEARGYIFAFLFAALSFAYFIRLVKSPIRKNAILHSIFSLCLLYSHYYSLFVIFAQVLLAILFLYMEKPAQRRTLFRNLLLSFIIIGIGYIPWLPFLISMSEIKSFWISEISPGFVSAYFFEYFGNSQLLKPLLLLLLLLYFIKVSITFISTRNKTIKGNPLLFSFTVFIMWIFITYLIPYVRSLLVVPMLFPRYTIVVLPAILVSLAYSIELFKSHFLKYLITSLFVILSLVNICFVIKHYTTIRKTQFREMTEFVVKQNPNNFPILNQVTAWHHQYYLKRFHSKAEVVSGPKNLLIDSIVDKKWKLDGFWIVGAHGDKMLDTTQINDLSANYILLKQQTFHDAWAQLFISKSQQSDSSRMIGFNDFAPNEGTIFSAEEMIAVWGGAIRSKSFTLQKGRYDFTISARGTPVQHVFPHVNIYLNEKKIFEYSVSDMMRDTTFQFENPQDGEVVIKIDFDNDLAIVGEGD